MPLAPPGMKRPPSYGQEPKKKRKEQQGRPPTASEVSTGFDQPTRGPVGTPTAPIPTGKPIPVMQKYGYHGSIHDLNDRVERIATAYKSKFGLLPSWGLTFDLLRAPTDDFHRLFAAIPHSGAVARAQSALVGHGPDDPRPTQAPEKAFVSDLVEALKDDNLSDFLSANEDEFRALMSDKFWATRAAKALGFTSVEQLKGKAPIPGADSKTMSREQAALAKHGQLRAMGLVDIDLGKGDPFHLYTLGVTQIVGSLAYSPAAIYFTGKAGVQDIGAAKGGDLSFKHTRKIGEQAIKSVKEDITKPGENPGYLFLDALGVVSLGAGTGLRTVRALEAAGAGERASVVARTALSRPVGGTFELRKGGHSEHVLLLDNPVAQAAQRVGLKLRQRALDRRDVNPLGAQPLTSGRAIDLSSEAKLAREAEARKRVERAVARSYTTELEKAAGWSLYSAQVFSRVPHAIRASAEKLPGHAPFGLTRGEQKAIQVLSTDDPDPLRLHRDFHDRMKLTPEIGAEFGIEESQFIANHDRQLADLKMAEKVLDDLADGKARDRFVTALEETRRVIAEQERLKIEELGLLPEVAAQRVIGPADVMRTGEPMLDTNAMQAKLKTLQKALDRGVAPEKTIEKIEGVQGELQKARARKGPVTERPRTRADVQAELKRLDDANEKVLSDLLGKRKSIDPEEQKRRNKINGLIDYYERTGKTDKAGMKKALRAGRQSLLSDEAAAEAQALIQQVIAHNPDHPVVQAYARRIDEANRLRDLLNSPDDPFAAETIAPDFGTVVEGRDRATPESFYLPYQAKRHARTVPHELIRRARFGPFGVPRPRPLPELRHVFTGKSIIAGDYRIDATSLAGEAYGKTVRLVSIRNDHARLSKMAKDTQAEAGPFAVPIRDMDGVSDELRQRLAKIDEGEFTSRDAEALSASQVDALLKELYPNPAEPLENVKWVDARLIADEGIRTVDGKIQGRVFQGSPMAGIFDVVNEPFRFSYLFLRPAYALNLLGNTGMALMQQGVLLPLNIGRALKAGELYGPDVARAMDGLIGEGKMQAIAETAGAGKATAVSRTIAHSWSILTDRIFRRAALIHELRRRGYRTGEEIRSAIFDKANMTDLVAAQKAGNKAMVQFDNLTHYEKAVLRHVIFVYPWVSRSTVWTLRTLVEHPVQSAVLATLGEQAQDEINPLFEHMPDWIKRVGYIPVGWNGDGSPKVINPTSINTFSTLNDILQLAQGGETPEDLTSPVIEIGIRAFTMADQYGQRYRGNERFYGPFKGSVQQIPIVRGITGPKAEEPTKPLDVSDRSMLVKREREALKQTVLGGGWLGNWGSVIGGGLSPRELNLDAGNARYWRDQPLEARNKHERALIQQGLTIQGQLLKEDVPKAVRQGVDIAGEETLARAQRAKEIGRDVPAVSKEGALVDIEVLQKRGKLSSVEAANLTEKLHKLPDTDAVRRFVRNLHEDFAGIKQVAQWQADVNLVTSFRPDSAKARFTDLRKQGLITSAPTDYSQDELHELGRQVLAFQRGLRERKDAHKNEPSAESSISQAELRAFQDENDRPVSIGGKRFPSVVRLSWSMLTPQEQADHRVSIVKSDWKSLTAFDKSLLGKTSSAAVTRGWANLQRIVSAFKGQVPMPGVPELPIGQRTIARNQLVYLVKYVERGEKGYLEPSPGFFKDWLFAQKPNYQRYEALKPIQKSQYAPQWKHLFADANVLGSHLDGGVYSKTDLREAWRGYLNDDEFQTWLQRTPAGFRAELDRYGPDFLPGLLN